MFVTPIETNVVYLDLIKVKGKAWGKFPEVNLKADARIEKVRVNKKLYKSITGKIYGNVRLFSEITLKFIGNGERNLRFQGSYNVIPKGILTFSFENIPIDEKVLNVPVKLKALFEGKGEVYFRKGNLHVFAKSKRIKIANHRFKGIFDLKYKFKKRGDLIFLLENRGKLYGAVEFGNRLKGYVKSDGLNISFKKLNLDAYGDINFKKEKSFKLNGSVVLRNLKYSDFIFKDLKINGKIEGNNLKVFAYSGKTVGEVKGKFKELEGVIKFSNYYVKRKEEKLTVKGGLLSFYLKDKKLGVKGKSLSLLLETEKGKLLTKTDFIFKKGKEIELRGKGIGDIFFSEKKLLKEFNYSYAIKNNIFTFSGYSEEAKLSVVYNLNEKKGKFKANYKKGKLKVYGKGKIKKEFIGANLRILYEVFGENVKLTANIRKKNEFITVEIQPYRYVGKKLSVNFKGFKGEIEDKKIKLSFKGLDVKLLGKSLLTLYPTFAEGKTDDFLVPVKVSGIYRGAVSVGFRGEPLIVSSGILDITLLSDYIGSLMRSKLRGELLCGLVVNGKEFSFVATSDKPVKGVSRFFYEPFLSAIHIELDKKGMRFSQVAWFKEGYLNLFTFSKDFRNFEIDGNFKGLPFGYRDNVKLRIKADGNIRVKVEELKKVDLNLNTEFDGFIYVKKLEKKKQREENRTPLDIYMNISFKTKENLVVVLPEGRIFTNVEGRVYGKFPEIFYEVNATLRAGILNYFGKTFYLRDGRIRALKSKEGEITKFNLDLHTVEDNYKIFLSLKGTPDNPEVFYFSEPPLSRREILMRLIGGGVQESILPVDTVLQRELRAIGFLKSEIEKLLDIKLEFGVKTASTGEVGAILRLKKDIGRFLSVYYQTSTSEDKRETYIGGELRFPTDMDLGFRFYLYSDNTREYRLRYIKEFDF